MEEDNRAEAINLRDKALEWFFAKSEVEKADLKQKHFYGVPIWHDSKWGYHYTFGQIEEMYLKEINDNG